MTIHRPSLTFTALPTLLLTLTLTLTATQTHAISRPTFDDVSEAAGMLRPLGRRIKFGGPSVADLNADGYPDLLFAHHDDRHTDLYMNNGDGTFKRNTWGVWRDTHALNPIRLNPYLRRMHFCLSQGGSNGALPKAPEMYSVARNDVVTDVTVRSGISNVHVRGRTALFLQIDQDHRFPDVLFTSAPIRNEEGKKVARSEVYAGARKKRFEPRNATGLENLSNTYGYVTDLDGDGNVELLTYQALRMHRITGPFEFRDITADVFPSSISRVVGVAELDFDNDGHWDLYIARTTTENLKYHRNKPHDDILLRNVDGKYYEDVSASAGIPKNTQSRGVTVGDFNNDGFVDIVLPQYEEADILLMNNGDGTFSKMDAGLERADDVHGDQATAVDYDRDGKLDLIVSEGDWGDKNFSGFFRIMRNNASFAGDLPVVTTPEPDMTQGEGDASGTVVPVPPPMEGLGNYLLVRVRTAPKRKATSLHAVVTVTAPGLSMMRRVGSPGTVTSNSYIELLHFGCGNLTEVTDVTVRWTDGSWETKYNVRTNGPVIRFGKP